MNKKALTMRALNASMLVVVLAVTGCHRDPYKQKLKYLDSGKRYMSEGKYKEAAIQFSNALKIDHNFAEAHHQLGMTYLKMGSVMPGYSELRRAVAIAPDNAKARIDLGNLLVAGKQFDGAEEQAKAVLAAKPNDADAYALLSTVAAMRGDKPEALKQIQHAMELDPNHASYHTQLGMLQEGDAATSGQGEDQLRKAVALDNKNATAHLALAASLAQKGDNAGAANEAKAAVAADPKSVLARATLAQIYEKSGNATAAEATLRQAAEDLADAPGGDGGMLQSYYLHNRQIDRGAQVFGELSRKHSKSIPLKLTYTRFLLAKRDLPGARAQLAEMLKVDPNQPDVAVLNGMLLLNDGKTDEALDALQKASRNSPDNAGLQVWVGRAAMQKGDLSTAQKSFQEAARLSPSSVDARDGLAQIAMQRRDASLLSQLAEAGIKASPQNAVGYLWRGMAEGMQKQPDRAETDFREAIKLDPKNVAAFIELGQLKLEQGKYAEARPLLEEALSTAPGSARATGLLAASYAAEKQPQKAIAMLQGQISKVPQSGPMYTQLSELQMQTGDVAGALASAEKAVQYSPSEKPAVFAYTRAEIAHGDVGKAVTAWQQWLSKHPGDAQALAMLGTLQQQQGDKDAAIGSYKKALSIQPEQPIAANNLAYLMVDGGQNTDVALSLAQTARRLMPNSPSTADTLAWVYYAKGTYSSARSLLEEAAKQAPEDAAIQYHLGMTYMKLSDRTNAELHLKKAVALSPDSQTGKDAQKALSQG